METDDGGFVAALEGRTAPDTSDATGETQDTNAAGPLTGELPTEDAADAGSSPEATVMGADVAAVIAAAIVTTPVDAVVAIPVVTTTAGAVTTTAAVAAAPPQPLPGLVPAVLDGDSAVAPAPGAVATATPATTGETAETGTTPAATVTPGTTTTPAPAAQLTLTLSRIDPAAEGATPAVTAPRVTDEGPAPAAAPRPAGHEAAAVVAKAGDTPAPAVALATNAPVIPHVDPLDGLTRAGGMTTPHELARELGHRVQMAVREGGRELLITLRPPDLGHLTIRVTMTEGVMQAQIIADRPEAARLLQQSLQHLGSTLGDMGYSLDSLDVAYSGQDPRDAQSSSRGTGGRGGSEGPEADGAVAVTSPSTSAGTGDPGRLDLLA